MAHIQVRLCARMATRRQALVPCSMLPYPIPSLNPWPYSLVSLRPSREKTCRQHRLSSALKDPPGGRFRALPRPALARRPSIES